MSKALPDMRCSACGSEQAPLFVARDYNRRISDQLFAYHRCSNCGLISLRPVPSDLGRYYPSEYYSIPRTLEELRVGAEHERYKLDLVRRFASGGRLIEIGPSSGVFCYLTKAAGFSVAAIEMDSGCCRFLEEVVGVHAVQANDEARALEQQEPADVIALWHVIEHLPAPWALLEVATRKLRPGGVLVIATPNPAAFQFRVLGRYWTHVDAPRHVHLIPDSVLRGFVEARGLATELVTTTDAGSLDWNVFGWQMTFANALPGRSVKRGLRLIGRVLAAALRPIESREGVGSAYTAVFRRGARG